MTSLDNSADYVKIKDRIKTIKTYNDLKVQYRQARKQAGNTFEKRKSEVVKGLNDFEKNAKKYAKKQIKSQFEQLLEMLHISASDYKDKINKAKSKYDNINKKVNNRISSGKEKIQTLGKSNTGSYIKSTLTTALKNIEPKVSSILAKEILTAVGCDQQQTYTGGQVIYIKVKSIDLANLLKIDSETPLGKVLYEKNPIYVQNFPFSMNRELFKRIQTPSSSYNSQYGQNYKGASGQDLFDIQFVQQNNDPFSPYFGDSSGWFKITLSPRLNSVTSVVEFMTDYYKSIKLFDFHNVMANIMEALSGAVSIKANYSVTFLKDAGFFEKLLLRIFGLCFDNKEEIDVSGISKLGETGTIDDTFFELTSVELREIEQRVTNIKNGVVEFVQCENVKIPVNADAIISQLEYLTLIENELSINKPEDITNALLDNSTFEGLGLDAELEFAVDWNFLNSLAKGLIFSLLSPKVLLPIFTMFKALNKNGLELVDSYLAFSKLFSKFLVNLASKVNALLIEELFELLKKDIKNLIQQVILDITQEKGNKKLIMILKLTNILINVAQFIDDLRRCKSVIDEILRLLQAASNLISKQKLPLPLLFLSEFLDGFSESRAFLRTIEELQKIGVPTGPLPDGSPNLEMLSRFAQLKAVSEEDAENNSVQIALRPISITPAGLTVPATAFGKKF